MFMDDIKSPTKNQLNSFDLILKENKTMFDPTKYKPLFEKSPAKIAVFTHSFLGSSEIFQKSKNNQLDIQIIEPPSSGIFFYY